MAKIMGLQQLEQEQARQREEIASLRRDVSQKVSQDDISRGLTAVSKGLEVVESNLLAEASTRQEEMRNLSAKIHDTLIKAAAKLRDEFTALSTEIKDSRKGPAIVDLDNKALSEFRNEMQQLKDSLTKEELRNTSETSRLSGSIHEIAALSRGRGMELAGDMNKLTTEFRSRPWVELFRETEAQTMDLSAKLESLQCDRSLPQQASSSSLAHVWEETREYLQRHEANAIERIENIERYQSSDQRNDMLWQETKETLQRQGGTAVDLTARVENIERAQTLAQSQASVLDLNRRLESFEKERAAPEQNSVMGLNARIDSMSLRHTEFLQEMAQSLTQHDARLGKIDDKHAEFCQETALRLHNVEEKNVDACQRMADSVMQQESSAFSALDDKRRHTQAALYQEVETLAASVHHTEAKEQDLQNEVAHARAQLAQQSRAAAEVSTELRSQQALQDRAAAELNIRLAAIDSDVADNIEKLGALQQACESRGTELQNTEKSPGSPGAEKVDKAVVLELSALINALQLKSDGIHQELSTLRESDLQSQAYAKKLQDEEAARLNTRIDGMYERLSMSETRAMELRRAQEYASTDKVDKTEVLQLRSSIDELQERLGGVYTSIAALQDSDMQTKVSTNSSRKLQETEAALINTRIDKLRDSLASAEAATMERQCDRVDKADILRLSQRVDGLRENYEGVVAEVSASKTCSKSLASVQQKVQETDSVRIHSRLDRLCEDYISVHAEISVLNRCSEASAAREGELQKGLKMMERNLSADVANKLTEHSEGAEALIRKSQSASEKATQTLIQELQKEIQANMARDNQLQVLGDRTELNAELTRGVSTRTSELHEEFKEAALISKDYQAVMSGEIKAAVESSQARVLELQKEVNSMGAGRLDLQTELSKKLAEGSDGAGSEIKALQLQTTALEARLTSFSEELIRGNGAQGERNAAWTEECREIHAALTLTDNNLDALNTQLQTYATAAGSAAADRSQWSELSSECREECSLMKDCMNRTEKAEAGIFASQHIEREARKNDTAKLTTRIESVEKELDQDRPIRSVSGSAGNYLLGASAPASATNLGSRRGGGTASGTASPTPPPSSYLLSERQVEPSSPRETSVVIPGSSVIKAKDKKDREPKSPSFGFRNELAQQDTDQKVASKSEQAEQTKDTKASPTPEAPKSGSLPKTGETWVFTDKVGKVAVFNSSAATNKIHDLSGHYDGGKLRRIEILTDAESGLQYVHFKGTQNLHWLEGWIAMYDDDGIWNIVKQDDVFDQDSDCAFS